MVQILLEDLVRSRESFDLSKTPTHSNDHVRNLNDRMHRWHRFVPIIIHAFDVEGQNSQRGVTKALTGLHRIVPMKESIINTGRNDKHTRFQSRSETDIRVQRLA